MFRGMGWEGRGVRSALGMGGFVAEGFGEKGVGRGGWGRAWGRGWW